MLCVVQVKYAMIYLLVFILLISRATAIDNITINCQDEQDFYQLMYSICRQCILCRELYFINAPSVVANEYDFRKFYYQLSQILLFNGSNIQSHYHHHNYTPNNTPFINYMWPSEWLPTIQIEYTTNVSCNTTFNYSDTANRDFLLIAVDLMKTYKEYVSNEHYCADYNERPVFDLFNEQFTCYCIENKQCNNEGNYKQLIFLLMLMVIGLLVAVFSTELLIAIRLINK